MKKVKEPMSSAERISKLRDTLKKEGGRRLEVRLDREQATALRYIEKVERRSANQVVGLAVLRWYEELKARADHRKSSRSVSADTA